MESRSWLRTEDFLKGVLIGPLKAEEEIYLVLFPYTKQGVREIRPGTLVGARNFESTEREPSFTVLEITNARPVHYALGESAERSEKAYPGFLVEAAKAAVQDWEQTEPIEETTKIRAEVVPTGLTIMLQGNQWKIEEGYSLPMPGGDVILLTPHGMDKILNKGLRDQNSVEIAMILVNDNVPLRLRPIELIRKHFGVFGFTGTGKSNLISTLVARLIESSRRLYNLKNLRVIIVDYMNEYFPLLADVFSKYSNSYLVYLDETSLHGGDEVLNALAGKGDVRNAADILAKGLLIPEELAEDKESYERLVEILAKMISHKRVKVLTDESLQDVIKKMLDHFEGTWKNKKYTLGRAEKAIKDLMKGLKSIEELTVDELKTITKEVRNWIKSEEIPEQPLSVLGLSKIPETDKPEIKSSGLAQFFNKKIDSDQAYTLSKTYQGKLIKLADTAKNYLSELADSLEKAATDWERTRRLGDATISVNSLISLINGVSGEPALIVVLSDKPDYLREFFAELATKLYNIRKKRGQSSPPCLFIVDEADEFISSENDPTYKEARRSAETIARRGRKLGLGLGIATQRVTYLDTKVISQLHTYFVSKLPRASDRERVAEAYGVPKNYIDRVLMLRTGEWLIMSHSATSIRGKPILAKFENAVERVWKFLKNEGHELKGSN